MTGGLAFVVDDSQWLDGKGSSDEEEGHIPFERMVNPESITLRKVTAEYRYAPLPSLILQLQPNETQSYLIYTPYICHIPYIYDSAAVSYLKTVLESHVEECQSNRAAYLLQHIDEALGQGKITLVVPNSEKNNPLLVRFY